MSTNLKAFDSSIEYESYMNSGSVILPNVSYIRDDDEVKFT